MAKQHLLIVDSDPKSLRVLEVSLKKAGFSITRASNGLDAIEKIQISIPDMIITETSMPEMGGFELIDRLKEHPDWQDIPVMFLTAQKSIEDKIRGLEQGVEDYLTKPIFIREILARVALVMQRRQRERLETRGSKTEFSGSLSDMGIIDLIQTIDISQKSGVIHVEREGDQGEIYFKNGKVIDAETSSRQGEEAVYRMLVWSSGHFHIEFNNLERTDKITLSTQGLLMEGMRRLDEWGRLQEQLPSLNSVFDIDDELLAERLGEIPDEINALLKHFDGRRSLMEVVNLCPLGDLEALTIITKLYFEGLICDLGISPDVPTDAPEAPVVMEDTAVVDSTDDITDFSGDEVSPPPADAEYSVEPTGNAPVKVEEDSLRSEHSQTMRIATQRDLNVGNQALRQSIQGNFVNVISRSSTPAGPTTEIASDTEPPRRPDTGEYKLSRHPMPATMSNEESKLSGVSSAGLSAVVSEQQTMMMHVSRTPTNPPPAVARMSTEAPNPLPISGTASEGNKFGAVALPTDIGNTDMPTQTHDGEAVGPQRDMLQPDMKDTGQGNDNEMEVSLMSDEPKSVSVAMESEAVREREEVETTIPSEVISDEVADAEEISDIQAPVEDSYFYRSEAAVAADDAGEETGIDDHSLGTDVVNEETAEEEDESEHLEEIDGDDNIEEGDGEAEDGEFTDEAEDEWAMVDDRSTRNLVKKVLVGVAAAALLGGSAALYFGTDLLSKSSPAGVAEKKQGSVLSHDDRLDDAQKKAADEQTIDGEPVDSDVLAAAKLPDDARESSATDPLDTSVGEDAAEDTGEVIDTDSQVPIDAGGEAVGAGAVTVGAGDVASLTKYHELVERSANLPRKKKLEVLEQAIALNPNGVEALTEFAISTMETKKYQDQALEYAERVTLLEPKNAKAWLAIGYIYQLKNDTDKSTAAYQKCAECDEPKEYVRNCKLLSR